MLFVWDVKKIMRIMGKYFWILHYDNALAYYTSIPVHVLKWIFGQNNFVLMPQSPYSPVKDSCESSLFLKRKRRLKGQPFDKIKKTPIKQTKKNCWVSLKSIVNSAFPTCFAHQKELGNKCITSDENYIHNLYQMDEQ